MECVAPVSYEKLLNKLSWNMQCTTEHRDAGEIKLEALLIPSSYSGRVASVFLWVKQPVPVSYGTHYKVLLISVIGVPINRNYS